MITIERHPSIPLWEIEFDDLHDLVSSDVGSVTFLDCPNFDIVNEIPEVSVKGDGIWLRVTKDKDLSEESIEKIKCYMDYMKL